MNLLGKQVFEKRVNGELILAQPCINMYYKTRIIKIVGYSFEVTQRYRGGNLLHS